MSAPRSRAEATIARILAAARSLFLTSNYADVSMAEIARSARVTKGALYHHFDGKEELYLAMMHAFLDAQRDRHLAAGAPPGSCRQRLRRLTAAFFERPPEERRLMRLVRRDINKFREPARSQLVRAYQQALPEPLATIIRDGIQDGELRGEDARLLSWHYVALVEVALTDYAAQLFPEPSAQLEQALELFFSGAAAERSGGHS